MLRFRGDTRIDSLMTKRSEAHANISANLVPYSKILIRLKSWGKSSLKNLVTLSLEICTQVMRIGLPVSSVTHYAITKEKNSGLLGK